MWVIVFVLAGCVLRRHLVVLDWFYTDEHDAHTLTFTNLLDRPIRITLGDAYLGRLFSGESETFGPVAGDWRARPKIVLRDRNDVQMQLEEYFLTPAPIVYRRPR